MTVFSQDLSACVTVSSSGDSSVAPSSFIKAWSSRERLLVSNLLFCEAVAPEMVKWMKCFDANEISWCSLDHAYAVNDQWARSMSKFETIGTLTHRFSLDRICAFWRIAFPVKGSWRNIPISGYSTAVEGLRITNFHESDDSIHDYNMYIYNIYNKKGCAVALEKAWIAAESMSLAMLVPLRTSSSERSSFTICFCRAIFSSSTYMSGRSARWAPQGVGGPTLASFIIET